MAMSMIFYLYKKQTTKEVELTGLKVIKKITLKNCPVVKIIPIIRSSSFQSLILTKTSIEAIPNSILFITNLTGLFISDTGISLIPYFICQLTKLVILDLQNTKNKELPSCMLNIESLKRIDIRKYLVNKSSKTFKKLVKKGSELKYNREFSNLIERLKNIQNLFLNELNLKGLQNKKHLTC